MCRPLLLIMSVWISLLLTPCICPSLRLLEEADCSNSQIWSTWAQCPGIRDSPAPNWAGSLSLIALTSSSTSFTTTEVLLSKALTLTAPVEMLSGQQFKLWLYWAVFMCACVTVWMQSRHSYSIAFCEPSPEWIKVKKNIWVTKSVFMFTWKSDM